MVHPFVRISMRSNFIIIIIVSNMSKHIDQINGSVSEREDEEKKRHSFDKDNLMNMHAGNPRELFHLCMCLSKTTISDINICMIEESEQ